MTSGEQMILDALVSVSKSMNRIADELKAIREVVTFDHRQKLMETRRSRFQNREILTEGKSAKSNKDERILGKTPLENIRDIREGRCIMEGRIVDSLTNKNVI